MGKGHAATGNQIRLAVGVSTLEHVVLAPALERDVDVARRAMDARASAAARRRGWFMPRMLLLADLVGVSAAALAVTLLWSASSEPLSAGAEVLLCLVAVPTWLLVAKLHGLYDRDQERADNSTVDDLVGVFHVVTIVVWVSVLVAVVTGSVQAHPGQLAAFWVLAFAFVTAGRGAARAAGRRSPKYVQNTIIVGAGDIGQLVARKLTKHPEYGLNLVGFVDSAPKSRRKDLDDLNVLGRPDDLRDLIERHGVERVVIAFSNDSAEATLKVVREVGDLNVQVDVVPRLFELVGPKANFHSVEGLPLVGVGPARLSPAARAFKRTVDVVVSAAALFALSPVLAYIAFRIKRDSPGPVFFRQGRLGLHMREFTALKFRTMKVDTDQEEHRRYIKEISSGAVSTNGNGLFKLERRDAITPFGHWLRKTSLDELPQLINVLRGDMSLVGPRPCIPYETESFKAHHFDRFLVPAGITGLWQVTARANSTFGEALDMDVAYARGWSPGLDIRLLLRTPFQLLRQRGATA
jgi:exopolysaccharide biosynthesis polyprenyl glycosylphosphotransferase